MKTIAFWSWMDPSARLVLFFLKNSAYVLSQFGKHMKKGGKRKLKNSVELYEKQQFDAS